MTRICQVQLKPTEPSETFLLADATRLPCEVVVITGFLPGVDGRPCLSQRPAMRVARKLRRGLRRASWEREITDGYLAAFRRFRPSVVLAQYGPTGVRVSEACRLAGLPLVVQFHGHDASVRDVIAENAEGYRMLFAQAAGIIAVSREMVERLAALGAPRERLHYRPVGVDCAVFRGARPDRSPPLFVAAGRFVEKKAPHRTVEAFARVHRERPAATLHMIGDGDLLSACRDLSRALGVAHAIVFTGMAPHDVVRSTMQGARAFVQHSVEAPNGDREGTPVSVMEAGASGLPIVATRHGGIQDVVVEGQTGFLVDEHDTRAMAAAMCRFVDDPALAARLGQAGRERVQRLFSLEQSMSRLWSVLSTAMEQGGARQ